MAEDPSAVPDVTDEDVTWVSELMGFGPLDGPRVDFLKSRSTLDVSACPGSGKTTLIVAKLAILARKWSHRTRGICVLSHTNVAREQIEQRLGGTGVGQALLAYPHFIDTIHGFANRFLAIPWLNSNGFPSPTIGDDVAAAYRRRVLVGEKGLWKVERFLSRRRKSVSQLRLCDREFNFDLEGAPLGAGPTTETHKLAKQAIVASAQAGFFRYDEMFVWARCLLEDCPDLQSWLAHRFPLVLLDEMQDTDAEQGCLLDMAFPRDSGTIVVQRVGDPNQRIFQDRDSDSSGTPFPDESAGARLEISNSYRFGQDIASLASPLAVHPVGAAGLLGLRAAKDREGGPIHAIFVFPNESTKGVLEAYGRHLITVLEPTLLARGPISAVGHIHREPFGETQVKHMPKSVCHYWEGYSSEIKRTDSHPESLAGYVHSARALAIDAPALDGGADRIAQGILRLARRVGKVASATRDGSRPHRTVLLALEANPAARDRYMRILRLCLLEVSTRGLEDLWSQLQEQFILIARALCEGEVDGSKGTNLLCWSPDAGAQDRGVGKNAGPNVVRVTDGGRHVDIRLGSIHSVKGQTHVATMLLGTYWHDHSSQRILPWLLGHRSNGDRANNRDRQRLLHTYVAMTRPSHVLCLAVPRSSLGKETDENLNVLQERGWAVAEIIDGEASWRPQPDNV